MASRYPIRRPFVAYLVAVVAATIAALVAAAFLWDSPVGLIEMAAFFLVFIGFLAIPGAFLTLHIARLFGLREMWIFLIGGTLTAGLWAAMYGVLWGQEYGADRVYKTAAIFIIAGIVGGYMFWRIAIRDLSISKD